MDCPSPGWGTYPFGGTPKMGCSGTLTCDYFGDETLTCRRTGTCQPVNCCAGLCSSFQGCGPTQVVNVDMEFGGGSHREQCCEDGCPTYSCVGASLVLKSSATTTRCPDGNVDNCTFFSLIFFCSQDLLLNAFYGSIETAKHKKT